MSDWAVDTHGLRSWLFVPALRTAAFLPKAIASGTDAIVIDLEAATPPAERDRARDQLRAAAERDAAAPLVFVRIPNDGPGPMEADLYAALEARATGLVLALTSSAGDVRRLVGLLDTLSAAADRNQMPIVAMIETGRGVLAATEIAAAHERLAAVALGAEDLAADLGATRTRQGAELTVARGLLVLAAAAYGRSAIDTPWLRIDDLEGLQREAARGSRLGFSGKFAIHPSQVASINAAFTPSEREVRDARAVLDAYESAVAGGTGVAVLDGRMVDEPIARAAARVLARGSRSHPNNDESRGSGSIGS